MKRWHGLGRLGTAATALASVVVLAGGLDFAPVSPAMAAGMPGPGHDIPGRDTETKRSTLPPTDAPGVFGAGVGSHLWWQRFTRARRAPGVAPPPPMVYVGGQTVGVRLFTRGLLVVGFQRVGPQGESPAAAADVRIGDRIERVNGALVRTVDDLRRLIHLGGPQVWLTLRRGRETRRVCVRTVTDVAGNRHLGVYVRDKTTGIGTLTFFDPLHRCFGALGHVITDVDTGEPIEGSGALYPAEVTGIMRGEPGRPGEKKGHFVFPQRVMGEIEENCEFGVFGHMERPPAHLYLPRVIPVARPDEVHDGPAMMLTVLHGQRVEAYQVQIERAVHQSVPDTRSMVVRVTDPRLLREAGGIIQGMSGSPILQDGRLVGAVTHVFLSDVTRGYGVYAAWMVEEALRTAQHPRAGWPQAAWLPARTQKGAVLGTRVAV
ncbi:hypothetical protein GCM10010885_01850 [Alicyclobacillus cellulosilyticus]|uniref:Stage IV sporulation protein B n=1 Tax=Alicyclobacillus cellulosilyticus TaxID=1003997 RepID=A0A917K185_9BACL|nr:SpoIVB peptidase [Alicyclobacillus cellulosilyticus]GGI95816.1 hypothetical protein GCM10010885_01850 [Alicyclobacillus cellulosilyticus]